MPPGKLSRETGTELGHNNPGKTTPITTIFGRRSRHQKQGRRLKDTAAEAPTPKLPPRREGYSRLAMKADSRALQEPNKAKREVIHKTHGAPPAKKPVSKAQTEAAYDADLRPHDEAGLNHGLESAPNPTTERTAADIKGLRKQLPDLTNEELKSIPILATGTPLAQGASYLDLSNLKRGQFTARGGEVAPEGAEIIPRKEVDYQLWDRLLAMVEGSQSPPTKQ